MYLVATRVLWRSRGKEPARRAAPPPGAEGAAGRTHCAPAHLRWAISRHSRWKIVSRVREGAERRRRRGGGGSIGEGSEGGGVSSELGLQQRREARLVTL
jgi:hypothetical protein